MEQKLDREHNSKRVFPHNMMTTMKQWFKDKNVLFCTNGDIVPDSPLLDSIATYKDVVDNNLLCIPGKNIANNNPIFGLQAF